MPKKISLMEKRGWLDAYESGKSIESIAIRAHRDVRTIRKGVDDAQREADARNARAELLKEALHKHQSSLLKMLDEILALVVIPSGDSIALSWETSAFKTSPAAAPNPAAGIELRPAWGLLQEHLKRDPLWRMFADWQKAYVAHWEAKIAFQRKTVALLKAKTGYKVVDATDDSSPPFVYIYTAAPLLFETVIRRVIGIPERTDPLNHIVANAVNSEVRYGGSVLAKAPGKEEECKRDLLAALQELQKSSEAARVAGTYKAAYEQMMRTRKAVEEISLLGLVPGQCRICRRLGL